MSDFRRHLPPLGALVIFEAAARRMSFTRAAEEIGITQAAVSRQIQSLERSLGFPLFRRKHRGIELTERGRMLSRTMSDALGRISETVETITDRNQSAELVIAATVAFSHFWLLPKISGFRRAHPDIRLKIVAQDGWVDLMQDEATWRSATATATGPTQWPPDRPSCPAGAGYGDRRRRRARGGCGADCRSRSRRVLLGPASEALRGSVRHAARASSSLLPPLGSRSAPAFVRICAGYSRQ